MTHKTPPELINPAEFPDALYDEWEWSRKLDAARGEGFSGAPAVSFQEMAAFFALRGVVPQAWQVDLLQTLDQIAIGRLVVALEE